MSKSFWDAVIGRRSIYGLSNEEIVPQARVEQIVKDAVKHVPSPFNSQSTRVLLLFGDAHRKLWRITLDALKSVTPPESFGDTEAKIRGSFASGYGTVLYFIDNSVVEAMEKQFPLYAANFMPWAHHSSAMHQFVVWTGLEAEGLGASLQHYSPLIDDAVRAEWSVPQNWQFVAQMPFGKPTLSPGEKEFSDIDARVKVYR